METKFPRRILYNMDELKRLDIRGGAISRGAYEVCWTSAFYFVNFMVRLATERRPMTADLVCRTIIRQNDAKLT